MKSIINYKQTFTILFLMAFTVLSLSAENILLKKGGIVKGKVVEQDQNKIKVKKEDGSTVVISKSEILKVVYKEHLTEGEEDKLRKAEEAKVAAAADKERIKKEKEDAERLKKELAEKEKSDKDLASKNVKEEAERKKKAEEQAKLDAENLKGLTRGGATWRSAVLPGWGQWKQGRKIPAIVYPTLIAVGLFFTYDRNRIFLNAKNDYNNLDNPYTQTGYLRTALGGNTISTTPADPLAAYTANEVSPFKGQRESVEKHYRELQYIGGATALLYVWNILDAFIFHPKQNLADADGIPEKQGNQMFLRTTMDRLDVVPYSSVLERRYETKTNLGYEIQF
ncbi:LA_0442/LA_0875 N-terminal domain-containing protein [Leptospira sp. 'Mane']|uniref:LA_0442/LA_0875 N-terminal domain-containing protein n=1 Tax=Leptospira sp. 'Mane' TaxID=3387407 RepID=UPI00398AEDF1